jgi:hypothetical protein
VGKHEGKRSLARQRRRYEDRVKMHFKEQVGRAWTVLFRLIAGISGGNENSGSIIIRKLLSLTWKLHVLALCYGVSYRLPSFVKMVKSSNNIARLMKEKLHTEMLWGN